MYEAHFRFDRRPFSLTPDPEFLYWTRHHRLASQILEMGVRRLSPITMVTGELGAGKTTLVRQFLETVSDELRVGLLSNVIGDSGDLYRWVLMAFGEEAKPGPTAQLVRQVQSLLTDGRAEGRSTVLIVDEAQNVSDSGLESLRLLTNVNSGKDVPLMLVLVGQPELRDRLRQPRFRAIAQRVGASFHLGTMSAAETAGYVQHRIAVANGPADLFTDGALQAIHEGAEGIPRLTNTLCEMCLISAFGEGVRQIDAAFVRSIRSEVQEQSVAYGLGQAAAATQPASRPARRTSALSSPPPAKGQQRGDGRIRLVKSDPAALRSAVGAGPESRPTVALVDNAATEAPDAAGRNPELTTVPPAAPQSAPAKGAHRVPAAPGETARGSAAAADFPPTDTGTELRGEAADEIPTAEPQGQPSTATAGGDLSAESDGGDHDTTAAGDVAARWSGRLRRGRTVLGLMLNGALVAAASAIALALLIENSMRDADGPAALRAEIAPDAPRAQSLDATGASASGPPKRAFDGGAGLAASASTVSSVADRAASRPASTPAGGAGATNGSDASAPDAAPLETAEIAAADHLYREALESALTDPAAAAVFYARAAVRGHHRAAYYLGQMYETGDGVPQDRGTARAWYQAAADAVAGARRRLSAIPARPVEASVDAPAPVFSGLTEAGHAELVWTGGTGPFVVELAGARDGGAQAAFTVGTSSARLPLPPGANFWRVSASGGRGPASEWQPVPEVATR